MNCQALMILTICLSCVSFFNGLYNNIITLFGDLILYYNITNYMLDTPLIQVILCSFIFIFAGNTKRHFK